MQTTPDCALSGALTIQSAAEQHTALRDALAAGASVLDLSAVQACDTSGVQLLLAASRHAKLLGNSLALRHASDPVREALQRYGLERLVTP